MPILYMLYCTECGDNEGPWVGDLCETCHESAQGINLLNYDLGKDPRILITVTREGYLKIKRCKVYRYNRGIRAMRSWCKYCQLELSAWPGPAQLRVAARVPTLVKPNPDAELVFSLCSDLEACLLRAACL